MCSSHREEIITTHETESMNTDSVLKKSKHHTENGFQNHPPMETASSLSISFYFRRVWHSIFLHNVPDNHFMSETEAIKLKNTISGDSVTWLGHATFLIRVSGKTILTDPFLSKYSGPFSFGGPQRMLSPGISLDHLPQIDIILVSHNHYDHLDEETIRNLPGKKSIQVVVPLGLKQFFKERGYSNVSEIDWHDEFIINEIKLTSLPAVHNSGRGLSDRNETLWT